ncbi:MAG: choice-of-anchor Q domain-containing protein [Acidobacteriota bacterium]
MLSKSLLDPTPSNRRLHSSPTNAVLVTMVLAFLVILPQVASGAIHTVCASGCDFTRIAPAVAAAQSGDEIVLQVEWPQVHTEAGLVIDKNLTLRGLGREITVLQAASTVESATDRILSVGQGASFFLQDLTLRHGSQLQGGAVLVDGQAGFTTDLTVRRVRFQDNRATSLGGGLYAGFSTVITVIDSVFEGNAAPQGGGFHTFGADINVRESLIRGNDADLGGGAFHSNGDFLLWNSTVTENTASMESGGLHIPNSLPVLRHVTLVDNSAPTTGGLTHLAATVSNTVIADNPGGDCSREIVGAGPRNWDSDGSCGISVVGTGDPELGPLRDNGGPTLTRAPQEESPLLDAGRSSDCALSDQRGLDRDLGGDCDIGAYERYEIKTCESPNLTIPDGEPAGVSQTVFLDTPDGVVDRIVDVNASLFVLHGWVGDLTTELSHDGISVALLDRPGIPATQTGCSHDDILAAFDSSMDQPAEDECSTTGFAIGGRFAPHDSLDGFRRRAGNGDWTLTITDELAGFPGSLLSWCVYVELFDGPPETPLFSDGFETGDLMGWTGASP